MGTKRIEFDYLDNAVEYMKSYFKEHPAPVEDTEARIFFERSKYCLILTTFDWEEA